MTDLPPPPGAPPPPSTGGGIPPTPGFSTDPKQAKAQAKAAQAHAKAVRPWFKKKRFIIGGIIALLVVVVVATSGGEEEDVATSTSPETTSAPNVTQVDNGEEPAAEPQAGETSTTEAPAPSVVCKDAAPEDDVDTKNQDLYPDRPDRQDEDHEVAVGDCARLSGLTAYVDGSAVESPEFLGDVFVVSVRLQNRDDSAQAFNMFDWSLLTPGGTIVNPTISLADDALDSGDLVKGGEAKGSVAFDVSEPGTYFVIYTPDVFEDGRAIWQVNI